MDLPSPKPTIFQNEVLPTDCSLAGLSALVQFFDVKAPVRRPACISEKSLKGHIRETANWRIFSKRYAINQTVEENLDFAMRYEDLDLLVLKRLFLALPPKVVVNYVQSAPTSIYTRRIWYLFELLTETQLKIPDAPNVRSTDLLDTKKYFARPEGDLSSRHKVRDNLLGTAKYCPIIRKTDKLSRLVDAKLSEEGRKIIGRASKAVIARAASFLLLADSQASFQIEGERPPRNRIERWGKAVLQAGKLPLSKDEIIRLHRILIEDNRFVQAGLRKDGVFLGERTYDNEPIPEFIGAKENDLESLMDGLVETNEKMHESNIDPVLQAAATAFGFVYIHPFQDGNGRLHRWLIHHTLTDRKFSPPGILFPVSSVMLDWIEQYGDVLKSHSSPLMEFIDWTPTQKGNVQVTNDTIDLYRFFDCTNESEFLYSCVERTIIKDLPNEIEFLARRDEAIFNIMNIVEMPDRIAEKFVHYVQRNDGKLPKHRRKEFEALTEAELEKLESTVRRAFE
ncbi:MAG: Fic family protein [Cyanobacteria bacterium HKST-UBA01]|nr:Fic family protein [Cyanobacteria bacterium HKST-UBA01]